MFPNRNSYALFLLIHSGCELLSEAAAPHIGLMCPNLRYLDMAGTAIGSQGLSLLVSFCRRLVHLDISRQVGRQGLDCVKAGVLDVGLRDNVCGLAMLQMDIMRSFS